MAGDKFDCSNSQFHLNGEKIKNNEDPNLNVGLEDEFSNTIEHVPCPEFQFSTTTCYMCNGYYGPCFGEPVCGTCHAFLFPDDAALLQVPILSKKTDDQDSGNDEPTDLCYNVERRTSQQQLNSPQNANPGVPQSRDIPNPNLNSNRHPYLQLQNQATQNYFTPRNNASADCAVQEAASSLRNIDIPKTRQSPPLVSCDKSTPDSNYVSLGGHLANLNAQDRVIGNSGGAIPRGQCTTRNSNENPQDSVDDDDTSSPEDLVPPTDNPQKCDTAEHRRPYPWNCKTHGEIGEPSRPRSLSKRLELLTNHEHIEHEPINEPGLVERLPPEVLLAVFSHLDDISLWSAEKVCRRWHGLLTAHITPQQWQEYVKIRWPLYRAIGHVGNWYKVYDYLASSAPCRTCLAQTSLSSMPLTIEDSSWRKSRLRIELKSLRIDPPEGIKATPLDKMRCHWQATITGPVGSPYEGGLFYLYLQVPHSYPIRPPIVRFLTKILHPNVSRHGDIGIDSIHHNWSLALTISKVLISVQSLLTDPYCQVCMEPELGEMYMKDRERFEEVARAWTWKYAMHDVITSS